MKCAVDSAAVLCLLVGVLTVVPQTPAAAATTWYVATTDDDTNDCLSGAAACATIGAAIGNASAGDTILVATGTYPAGSEGLWVTIDRNLTVLGGWDAAFAAQTGRSVLNGNGVWVELGIVASGDLPPAPTLDIVCAMMT